MPNGRVIISPIQSPSVILYRKEESNMNSIKNRHKLTIENDIKKLNENIELQILSILIMKSVKLYWETCLLKIVLKFNLLRLIPLGYTEDNPRMPTQKPLKPKYTEKLTIKILTILLRIPKVRNLIIHIRKSFSYCTEKFSCILVNSRFNVSGILNNITSTKPTINISTSQLLSLSFSNHCILFFSSTVQNFSIYCF